ncbi:MAG TPA: hypothetical protein VIK77_13375, partial [Tissierellaceae bacterium]
MLKADKPTLYISAIGIVALYLLIISYKTLYTVDVKTFIIFTLLSLFAEILPVRLMNDAAVTVGFAVFIGSILILGYKATIWIAFITAILSQLRQKIDSYAFYKKVFNVSLYIIMVGGSGYVYEELGGHPGYINLQNGFLGFFSLITAYFLINVGLLTIGLAILYNKPIKYIYTTNFKWALPSYIALAPLGILLAIIYINNGALGLVLFLIPLLIARHSFKLYMDMK